MQNVRKILLALLAFVLASCSAFSQEIEAPNRKIIYGLTLSPSGIDPHINRSTELGIVLRSVYDTLVYRHPETRDIVAGLAESWEISEDGLQYTFNLRQDVTFHDGTPFNAQAVAYNITRIFADETASQRARFLIQPVNNYEVIDDYTIRLFLSEPFQPLLDSLAQVYLGMASPNALAEYNTLRYQYHQVGTGPFEFVEYIPEDKIIIRRNPDYTWGPDFYETPTINSVEEIEFRFFRDAETRLLALENGDAQVIGELLPLDARAATNNPDIQVLPVPIAGQPLQFYMNTQQAPTDGLAVRQALAYGANRTSIVDAVFGGFSPIAWGPISSETLFYNRGVQSVYDYNSNQALQLLAGAGYTDTNNDGLLDRDGEVLELNVIQPPWGLLPPVTQLLQDQWQSLGIRVNVTPVPGYPALLEATADGEYNLVSFDQPGIDPYILNQAFLSNSQDNWTGYVNTDLDDILLQAAQTRDFDTRRQLYGRAQATILEQALIIPIREYVNLNAHVIEVQNLQYDAYGWFPILNNVTLAEGYSWQE